MGISERFPIAFAKSQMAAGTLLPTSGKVFISVTQPHEEARGRLGPASWNELGFELLATRGTARRLEEAGIRVQSVKKLQEGHPNVLDYMIDGRSATRHQHAQRQGRAHRRRPHPARRRLPRHPLHHHLEAAEAAVGAMEALRDRGVTVQAVQDRFPEVAKT